MSSAPKSNLWEKRAWVHSEMCKFKEMPFCTFLWPNMSSIKHQPVSYCHIKYVTFPVLFTGTRFSASYERCGRRCPMKTSGSSPWWKRRTLCVSFQCLFIKLQTLCYEHRYWIIVYRFPWRHHNCWTLSHYTTTQDDDEDEPAFVTAASAQMWVSHMCRPQPGQRSTSPLTKNPHNMRGGGWAATAARVASLWLVIRRSVLHAGAGRGPLSISSEKGKRVRGKRRRLQLVCSHLCTETPGCDAPHCCLHGFHTHQQLEPQRTPAALE